MNSESSNCSDTEPKYFKYNIEILFRHFYEAPILEDIQRQTSILESIILWKSLYLQVGIVQNLQRNSS